MSQKKIGGSSSSSAWNKIYSEIKNKHDEAFSTIDQAISLEEREEPLEAIEKYKKGINLIDEALRIQVQCPDNPDITWEKACVMIQKIKKARAEVLTRINSIQASAETSSTPPEESPPSYEEVVSSSEDEAPKTYQDLATALRELSIDPNQNMQEEVIYTHDNIRVYFISPNGEVTSTRNPEVMKISLVEGTEPNAPKAVLQIGTWVYPLVPGVSPCYRTDYGAFILPDLNATIPGSSVGILLPSDADKEVFDLLESILHGIISSPTGEAIEDWRKRRQTVSTDYSTRISTKLVDGAWFVSQGLIRGAQKAGDFMNRTTPKVINNLQSTERPANIPPSLSRGMEIAQTATGKAAQITEFVAEKVGCATVRLGQFLAPHIQKQGTRLLSSGFHMSEQEASDKMKGALTVAAGAVEGFSTIYRGLETSACILGTNLKENTVKIVEHRYGYPASTLTGDTLTTVGNVVTVAHNAKILTPKGFMKRTIKNTGKGIVYTGSSLGDRSSVQDMAVDSFSTNKGDGSSNITSSGSKSSLKDKENVDESKKG
ncbi:spartin [Leptinotarsa decemlineata]|uniref:spartin n=1 Tax=Leptinotarsa decemlineata TaxID=7539 RepID=UPI003D305521